MATDAPGAPAATAKQLYQYAATYLRRNYLLTAQEIGERLRSAGVSFTQGMLNSQYALASYNVGREPTQLVAPENVPLPLDYYRDVSTPGGGPFRVTAVATVVNDQTGEVSERAITLTSRRSLSPDDWYENGWQAFLEYENRYGYTVNDINIVDPRIRR